MGAGYCTNDQSLTPAGTFLFTNGTQCYSHTTPPYGSTETYSVTIYGNNMYSATVTSSTTQYYPIIYLLRGRTSSDTNIPWEFTVTNTSFSSTSAN